MAPARVRRVPARPGSLRAAVHERKIASRQTRRCRIAMPMNGEVNQNWGVYRNACCGKEIIIREGATFPDCPNHPKSNATWKMIEVEVADVIVIKKAKADPAA